MSGNLTVFVRNSTKEKGWYGTIILDYKNEEEECFMAICPSCKKEMFINEDNVRCGHCGKRIYIDTTCPKGCKVKFYINDDNVHCPSCDFRKYFWEYEKYPPRRK